MSLPDQFLLRWYKHPESLLYALVSVHNNEWRLETRPTNLDKVFYRRHEWHSQEPVRKLFSYAGKQYRSTLMYTGFVALVGSYTIQLWDTIDHMGFLSKEFANQENYHFIILPQEEDYYDIHRDNIPDIPTLLPPPRQKYTSLHKIILDFCKLNKDSACPITMEPYKKTTVCITPCGHGIQYRAMMAWLQTSNQCPLCRSEVYEANLIRWQS